MKYKTGDLVRVIDSPDLTRSQTFLIGKMFKIKSMENTENPDPLHFNDEFDEHGFWAKELEPAETYITEVGAELLKEVILE